jgi:hypothetical protein
VITDESDNEVGGSGSDKSDVVFGFNEEGSDEMSGWIAEDA